MQTTASLVAQILNLPHRPPYGPPNSPYALLTATNVATPLSNWVGLLTNQFGSGGQFIFTNPIAPGESRRFFAFALLEQ